MKTIILLCLLLPAIVLGAPKPVKITFHIDSCEKRSVELRIAGRATTVKLDEKGSGVLQLNVRTPQYAECENFNIFLEPGKDLSLSYNAANKFSKPVFGGTGAPENAFLSNVTAYLTRVQKLGDVIRGQSTLDKVVADLLNDSAMMMLSAPFKEMEKQKARFSYAVMYVNTGKKSSKACDSLFRKMLVEDVRFLGANEYQGLLKTVIRKYSEETGTANDATGPVLTTVEHFKDQVIIDYLVDEHARYYLARNRIDDAGELISLYDKYVKDPAKQASFHQYVQRFATAGKGSQCVNFSYPDINGNKILLADLKGKYVLIDFWATWCGPCMAQMAPLRTLEEKYHGKNIVFVGVSVDKGEKNISNWKKKATELPGIQILATSRELENQFVVQLIPRYVLLDPQGRVMDDHLPFPSEPELARILEALPGFGSN